MFKSLPRDLITTLSIGATGGGAAAPLPSWNDTAPRRAIIAFVERVTKAGLADFVPLPERIAVFDNDGIVHHTDADREYAYDAKPKATGTLTTALADAPRRGWVVVDMKNDWKRVFQ